MPGGSIRPKTSRLRRATAAREIAENARNRDSQPNQCIAVSLTARRRPVHQFAHHHRVPRSGRRRQIIRAPVVASYASTANANASFASVGTPNSLAGRDLNPRQRRRQLRHHQRILARRLPRRSVRPRARAAKQIRRSASAIEREVNTVAVRTRSSVRARVLLAPAQSSFSAYARPNCSRPAVFGGRVPQIGLAHHSVEQRRNEFPAQRHSRVAVVALAPARRRFYHRVHDHVSRPGIERKHILRPRAGRNHRHVRNSADVQRHAAHAARPDTADSRRTEPAARPARPQPCPRDENRQSWSTPVRSAMMLGSPICSVEATRRDADESRGDALMKNRLPVRANQRNSSHRNAPLFACRECRSRKFFAQQKIQLADFRRWSSARRSQAAELPRAPRQGTLHDDVLRASPKSAAARPKCAPAPRRSRPPTFPTSSPAPASLAPSRSFQLPLQRRQQIQRFERRQLVQIRLAQALPAPSRRSR